MCFVLTRTWLGCAIISHPCEVCPGDELRPPINFISSYVTVCILLVLILQKRKLLVKSLVFSHLSYCLPVWSPSLTQQLSQRLERMQNRAVRLSQCKYLSKPDHVSEHYRQLKWLPLGKLIQLDSVRLMYCQYHRIKCSYSFNAFN